MTPRALGRLFVPQALRYEAHRLGARLKAKAALARLWRWELSSLCHGRPYRVLYFGLDEQRAGTSAVLNLDDSKAVPAGPRVTETTAVVTHARLANALRVPQRVQMVVPLQRAFDEVLRRFDPAVCRRVARLRHSYESVQAKDPRQIDLLADTMIEAYSRHRNGPKGRLDRDRLRRIALGEGRFDVLFRDRQIVGCRVGYPRTVGDSRFWVLWRVGYADEVLADARKLDDVHAMNVFTDLERVFASHYNYYDMGNGIAQPLDPHLQWRRRRGGLPIAMQTHEWLSIVLPSRASAQFLWDAPQLATDHRHLSLWVGHPAGESDEALLERCRDLCFDGLRRVHVHAEREPSRGLLAELAGLYERCVEPPEVVSVPASA